MTMAHSIEPVNFNCFIEIIQVTTLVSRKSRRVTFYQFCVICLPQIPMEPIKGWRNICISDKTLLDS